MRRVGSSTNSSSAFDAFAFPKADLMRIYLDHNATTPLRPEVVQVMSDLLHEDFGNPTSTHEEGARARAHVERARSQVARLLGTSDDSVIFTAGASEANNTVIYQLLDGLTAGRGLVTSAVEHPSILEPAKQLEKAGLPVHWAPVDGLGRVDVADVIDAARKGAGLVSLIWANNETGVIQPVKRSPSSRSATRSLIAPSAR